MPGGEQCVIELLEDESRKMLNKPLLEEGEGKKKHSEEEHGTLWNFFFRPCILGKDLLTIEKFGLVQYVSYLFPLRVIYIYFFFFVFFWGFSE